MSHTASHLPGASPSRVLARWAARSLAIVAAWFATAGPAVAAVALTDAVPANAMTCAKGTASAAFLVFNTPYRVTPPSGTATGDLLVLTIRTYNESNFLGNSVLPNAQSPAWTPLTSSGTTRSYYRIRQAGDPAQYTVVSVGALVTASAGVEASMVAFTGVDPVTPFANAGAQTTGSGTGAVSLPNAGVTRGGSLRFSALTTSVDSTFNFSGAAPLTQACDIHDPASSIATAYESGLGPGTTPTRSVTLGGAAGPAWVAQTYTIQPPLSACASGGLNLTAPASVTFPTVALNGFDQTTTLSVPIRVNDQTGIMAGWNLSATSTPFTSGGNSLPNAATTITGVTATAAAGNCSMPVNAVSFPLTLPTGVVAPPAARLFSAAPGTGAGPTDLALAMRLDVPANARIGNYSSTWTVTLVAGP